MAENSTQETSASVADFIAGVEHDGRRADALALVELMRGVTGVEPRMWGPSMVGFGKYRYRYDSGREGEMLRVGFSPRKSNLALYLIAKGDEFDGLLARLGKYKAGASCLYVNRLKDVDVGVLEALVRNSWQSAREKYGE